MEIFTKERILTPSWRLVGVGFKLVQEHIWPVMYLSLLPTALLTYVSILSTRTAGNFMGAPITAPMPENGLEATLLIAAFLWVVLTYPGFLHFQVQAIMGKPVDTMQSFKAGLTRLPSLIGTGFLSTVLVVIGLFLFIVPGLFLLRGLFLSNYYAVDKKLSPIAALKKSYQDSRNVSAWIWGVIGVVLVISFISSIFENIPGVGVVIGILITYLYIFLPALRYVEVAKNHRLDKVTEA